MASSYYMLNLNNKHLEIHYSFYLSVCVKLFITKKKKVIMQNKPSLSQQCFLLGITQEYGRRKMATHSSILAWKNPWTEESGGLKSMGLHNWACVHEGGGRWVGSNKLVELKKKKNMKWTKSRWPTATFHFEIYYFIKNRFLIVKTAISWNLQFYDKAMLNTTFGLILAWALPSLPKGLRRWGEQRTSALWDGNVAEGERGQPHFVQVSIL